MTDLKTCTKCGVTQPTANFDKYFRKKADRHELRSWCRACMALYARERYRRLNPEVRRYRNIDEETERTCRVCGVTKPIDQFHRSGGGRLDQGGARIYRRRVCGPCSNQQISETKRQWREAHPEAAAEENRLKARRYRQKNWKSNREYQREYHRRWAEENRDKVRAARQRYDAQRREKRRLERESRLSAVSDQSPAGGLPPGCQEGPRPEA